MTKLWQLKLHRQQPRRRRCCSPHLEGTFLLWSGWTKKCSTPSLMQGRISISSMTIICILQVCHISNIVLFNSLGYFCYCCCTKQFLGHSLKQIMHLLKCNNDIIQHLLSNYFHLNSCCQSAWVFLYTYYDRITFFYFLGKINSNKVYVVFSFLLWVISGSCIINFILLNGLFLTWRNGFFLS